MNYIQIGVKEDGGSYLSDRVWPLFDGDFTPPSPAGYRVSEIMKANGVLMMHHPAGYRDEWHCAPAPVLGTVLSGLVRIETSDGDARLLSTGDQFVAADLYGAGHKMEEANGGHYDLVLVMLENQREPAPKSDSS